MEPLLGRIDELTVSLVGERDRIDELQTLVLSLEAGESAEAEAARARHEVRVLDVLAAVLAGRRRDLEVRSAARRERVEFLEQRLGETERRLEADAEARAVAEQRRSTIDATLVALRRLGIVVEGRRAVVDSHHATLAERRRQQSEQVTALSARLDAERSRRRMPSVSSIRSASGRDGRTSTRPRRAPQAGVGGRDAPARPRRRTRGCRGGRSAAASERRECPGAGARARS